MKAFWWIFMLILSFKAIFVYNESAHNRRTFKIIPIKRDEMNVYCSNKGRYSLTFEGIKHISAAKKCHLTSCSRSTLQLIMTLAVGRSKIQALYISETRIFHNSQVLTLEYMPNLTLLELKNTDVQFCPQNVHQYLQNITTLNMINYKYHKFDSGIFSKLKKLEDIKIKDSEMLKLNEITFARLVSLKRLKLINNNLTSLAEKVFDKNDELRRITLKNNNFKSLPEGLLKNKKNLHAVSLKGSKWLKTLPSRFFSNLTKLNLINLNNCNLESLPGNCFQGSVGLNTIFLENNALQSLPKDIFEGLIKLAKIDLSFNRITTLPDHIFASCINLQSLFIHHNNIVHISNYLFNGLTRLKRLEINHNHITALEERAFSKLKIIEEIDLSNNNISDLKLVSNGNKATSIFSKSRFLKKLLLSNNNIGPLVPGLITSFPKSLQRLDLSFNHITALTDISFSWDQSLAINVSNNNIISIRTSPTNYFYTKRDKAVFLVIDNNPIECDCSLFNLMKVDSKFNTNKRGLIIDKRYGKCLGPKVYKNMLLSKFYSVTDRCVPVNAELDNKTLCPSECDVWRMDSENELFFNCSNRGLVAAPSVLCSLKNKSYHSSLDLTGNSIKEFPGLQNVGYERVTQLILSNNEISTIPEGFSSGNLKELFLDNNKIETLSGDVIKGFNSNLLKAKFGNNPWSCDCERIRDFQTFISNVTFIKDSNNITCKNSTFKIDSLFENGICRDELELTVIIIICLAFIALLIILLAVILRTYKRDIYVWLYAKQIGLWFIFEEDLDKEKPYDAFISYSHKDEDFVINQILQNLENGPNSFKLCVHFRDWLVGEWIPTQIENSINLSKRTIIVVSRNFMASEWGRMEFRAAHKQAMEERRNRVILILYEDLGPIEQIEPELKSYIRMNTYLKWGDSRFWEKLRYALPHKHEKLKSNVSQRR